MTDPDDRPMEERLAACRSAIEFLDAGRPSRVDMVALSSISKIPGKVAVYRAAATWRGAELARGALSALEGESLVVCMILVRSLLESIAGISYLVGRVSRLFDDGDVSKFDKDMSELLMGTRIFAEGPRAKQILTLIDKTDKSVQGFRQMYDDLCEVAHPNWHGTTAAYSDTPVDYVVDFGSGKSRMIADKPRLAESIDVFSQLLLLHAETLDANMPELIRICEAKPDTGSTEQAGTGSEAG